MQLASSIEIASSMESTISRASSTGHQRLDLPPGFRFHPTDEELMVHYLRNKVSSRPLPVPIIAEIDLYKFDPWDLPGKATCGENEWYFFTPRDRKYPNGARPNRAAGSGYWKATGTDKPIISSGSGAGHGSLQQKLGVKKTLVFYRGRPPKGVKTNWIMHEYRLAPETATKTTSFSIRRSLRLDDWVLCRIYRKSGHTGRLNTGSDQSNKSCVEEIMFASVQKDQQEADARAAAAQLYSDHTRRVGSLGRFILGSAVSDPFLDSLNAAEQAASSVTNLAAAKITDNNDPRNSWTNLAQLDSTNLANTITNPSCSSIIKDQARCSSMISDPRSLFSTRDIDHVLYKRSNTLMPTTNINNTRMGLTGLANIFPASIHHHQQPKAQCNDTNINGGGDQVPDSTTLRWPFADGRLKFPYA